MRGVTPVGLKADGSDWIGDRIAFTGTPAATDVLTVWRRTSHMVHSPRHQLGGELTGVVHVISHIGNVSLGHDRFGGRLAMGRADMSSLPR